MVIRFAHFADVHLGSFRDKRLRDLNLKAFEDTIDYAIKEKLDFVVIAGDLFDIAIPDLGVVRAAAVKLSELRKEGIPCYVIYGSHDYTPSETSVLDVLNAAGLVVKVSSGVYDDSGKLVLNSFKDEKTGVSLVGVSARAKSIDSSYFNDLDLAKLERISSPKIFVFHNTLAETKPDFLGGIAALPFSVFPKGFEYYAGGHVHEKTNVLEEKYGRFVFPGPLFAADYRDLEELSKRKSGFFVVEIENGKTNASFVELNICKVQLLEFNASNSKPEFLSEKLFDLVSPCQDSVVLVRLYGELDGNASEIDFKKMTSVLEEKNCILCLNRNALKSKSSQEVRIAFTSRKEVEEKVFTELIASQNYSEKLSGQKGVALSKSLFDELKQPSLEGESKKDYEQKIVSNSGKCFE